MAKTAVRRKQIPDTKTGVERPRGGKGNDINIARRLIPPVQITEIGYSRAIPAGDFELTPSTFEQAGCGENAASFFGREK
jgi:hypothetical protein